jgi:dienelactone hydrolase
MSSITAEMLEKKSLPNNVPLIYHDGDQQLLGKLFHPPCYQNTLPAIILFPAFEGLGAFALEYAEFLSTQGYIVLAADIYGDGQTSSTLTGCFDLIKPFLEDRSLVRRRARLAFDALSAQKNVNQTQIGAIGFCFGGQCMLELARSGAPLKAGVSAHGLLASSTLPSFQIQTNLLILHGFADPQVPPEHLLSFAQEMKKAQTPDWQLIAFSHAQHSFTDPKTGTLDPEREYSIGRVYDPLAATRAKHYAVNFFNEQFALNSAF